MSNDYDLPNKNGGWMINSIPNKLIKIFLILKKDKAFPYMIAAKNCVQMIDVWNKILAIANGILRIAMNIS
jgi:hypothetical protein